MAACPGDVGLRGEHGGAGVDVVLIQPSFGLDILTSAAITRIGSSARHGREVFLCCFEQSELKCISDQGMTNRNFFDLYRLAEG